MLSKLFFSPLNSSQKVEKNHIMLQPDFGDIGVLKQFIMSRKRAKLLYNEKFQNAYCKDARNRVIDGRGPIKC